eukprot:SAG11_NODE_21980_length_414_cov_1.771429_1_plen_70_part_01
MQFCGTFWKLHDSVFDFAYDFVRLFWDFVRLFWDIVRFFGGLTNYWGNDAGSAGGTIGRRSTPSLCFFIF